MVVVLCQTYTSRFYHYLLANFLLQLILLDQSYVFGKQPVCSCCDICVLPCLLLTFTHHCLFGVNHLIVVVKLISLVKGRAHKYYCECDSDKLPLPTSLKLFVLLAVKILFLHTGLWNDGWCIYTTNVLMHHFIRWCSLLQILLLYVFAEIARWAYHTRDSHNCRKNRNFENSSYLLVCQHFCSVKSAAAAAVVVIFWPTNTKHLILILEKCKRLLGCECVLKWDCVLLLQSHWQLLKQLQYSTTIQW